MTFSNEWEALYREGQQNSIWPWSDLVSYVMRYARPARRPWRVLELGVGAGANIPFFLSLEADYFGIEGSAHMVALLKQRYPQLEARLVSGDFTQEIPFPAPFDVIVDRSSVTHNNTASIQRCLQTARDKLRPGGAFIGIDWFSTEHSELGNGEIADDEHTRANFSVGQFAHVGKVHFSDEPHLRALLQDFAIGALEHKRIERREPPGAACFAAWNFAAFRKH